METLGLPGTCTQSDRGQQEHKLSGDHIAVSIKHGLRTTDYGLRTGYKTRTRYKTWTKHYGLGIKYRLRYKTRTEHYGLGIKHEERFYIE